MENKVLIFENPEDFLRVIEEIQDSYNDTDDTKEEV